MIIISIPAQKTIPAIENQFTLILLHMWLTSVTQSKLPSSFYFIVWFLSD